MITQLLIKILKFYKKGVSPLLGSIFGGSCRYTPTCSEYSIEAFEKYGLIKGLMFSAKRILRCHPFGGQGFDPLPVK